MIEEVKIMSKSEIENYINFFKNNKKEQFDFSQYSKEIHYQYIEIERSIIEDYNEKRTQRMNRKRKFDEKICDCGLKMRYINDYGFWGCPDYQNKDKKHNTFSNIYNEYPIRYDIPPNWLKIILRELKIDKKTTTKDLLAYLEYNHYDDLRLKYRDQDTVVTTDGFNKAKFNSNKTELAILKILEDNGFKTKSHLYIKYKLFNENKHRVCIPDIIASDCNVVFLIEVKENEMYVDKKQLKLYYDLMKKIMDHNKDTRYLCPLFIIGDKSENYLHLGQLLNYSGSDEFELKLANYEFNHH